MVPALPVKLLFELKSQITVSPELYQTCHFSFKTGASRVDRWRFKVLQFRSLSHSWALGPLIVSNKVAISQFYA
jgi:hypothetical protein